MLRCQKLCKNKNTAVAKYTKSVQYVAKLGILQKTPSVNFSSAWIGLSVPLGLAAFTINQCLLLLFCKSLPFLPVLSAAVQQRETVLWNMGQGLKREKESRWLAGNWEISPLPRLVPEGHITHSLPKQTHCWGSHRAVITDHLWMTPLKLYRRATHAETKSKCTHFNITLLSSEDRSVWNWLCRERIHLLLCTTDGSL